jgi:hypothetical protein
MVAALALHPDGGFFEARRGLLDQRRPGDLRPKPGQRAGIGTVERDVKDDGTHGILRSGAGTCRRVSADGGRHGNQT